MGERDALTPLQLRLLQAELAHTVELEDPKVEEIVKAIKKRYPHSKKLQQSVAEAFKRWSPETKVPTLLNERFSLLLSIFRRQ